MTRKILIYGTNSWPFCKQARAAYGHRATFINISQDPDKFDEMLKYSGGNAHVPVIVDGDKVTVGFLGDVSLSGGIPIFGGTWSVNKASRWEAIDETKPPPLFTIRR